MADLAEWLGFHLMEVLNVAGPRESDCPGIGDQAERFLLALFRLVADGLAEIR